MIFLVPRWDMLVPCRVDLPGGKWQLLYIKLCPGITKLLPVSWYADAEAEEYSGIERLKGECSALLSPWVHNDPAKVGIYKHVFCGACQIWRWLKVDVFSFKMVDLTKRKRSTLTQNSIFPSQARSNFWWYALLKARSSTTMAFFFWDRHGRKESHQLVGLIPLGDFFVPAAIGSSIQRALSELLKTEDRTGPKKKGFTIAYTFLPQSWFSQRMGVSPIVYSYLSNSSPFSTETMIMGERVTCKWSNAGYVEVSKGVALVSHHGSTVVPCLSGLCGKSLGPGWCHLAVNKKIRKIVVFWQQQTDTPLKFNVELQNDRNLLFQGLIFRFRGVYTQEKIGTQKDCWKPLMKTIYHLETKQ